MRANEFQPVRRPDVLCELLWACGSEPSAHFSASSEFPAAPRRLHPCPCGPTAYSESQ